MERRDRIDVARFIGRLDECFNRNDMRSARECIEYWELQARQSGDDRGLLTVLNEAVGYYRRTQKKTKALSAMKESLSLVEELGLSENLSGATVYINAATTLSFFGRIREGLELYGKAEACYRKNGGTQSYEYAALLNNKAAALNELKLYDEAEEHWKSAVEILKKSGASRRRDRNFSGDACPSDL